MSEGGGRGFCAMARKLECGAAVMSGLLLRVPGEEHAYCLACINSSYCVFCWFLDSTARERVTCSCGCRAFDAVSERPN